jgi:hypothetical protein
MVRKMDLFQKIFQGLEEEIEATSQRPRNSGSGIGKRRETGIKRRAMVEDPTLVIYVWRRCCK